MIQLTRKNLKKTKKKPKKKKKKNSQEKMYNPCLFETSETCLNADETQGVRGSDGGVNSPSQKISGKSPGKVQKSCDSGGGGDGNMNFISAYSPREYSSDLTSNEIKTDDPSLILNALTTKK